MTTTPSIGSQAESPSRLEAVLDGARLGSWDWWLQTNAVTFDRRWCEMLGLRVEDTPQQLSTWDERVHPEDKAKADEDIKAYLRGEAEYYENIHRLRHENGGWIWVLDRGRVSQRGPSGEPVRFTGTHLDITAYKNAEALNEAIQKIARIGGWELDVSSRTMTWSLQTYLIHGLPVGTPTDLAKSLEFYAEHERPRLAALIERCMAGEVFRDTFEFYNAQGTRLWVETMGEPVVDARDRVVSIRGTFQDVSESVESRQRLRHQHDQLERLVRNSPGMVYQFCREPSGRMYFSFVSQQAFDIYGVTPEDFAKNPAIMLERADPADAEGLYRKIDESFQKLAPFEWKGKIITQSGGRKWIMARSIPFKEPSGSVTWDGIVVDVTQEMAIAESLEMERAKSIHAAKLASLGEMAAGIAHEINNPLAIVEGTAQALTKFVSDPEKLASRVDTIVRATQRIAKIVNSLKKFARSSERSVHQPGSLRSAVAEALILTEAKAKRHGVAIRSSLTVEGRILCDEIEIEQVLVNLINNGIDAVAGCAERWVEIEAEEDEASVVLRVRDSGPGFSQDVRSRIFQPFFTTKPVGAGTGLGLSIVKGILDEHRATIELLASEPHTCFEIRFKRER